MSELDLIKKDNKITKAKKLSVGAVEHSFCKVNSFWVFLLPGDKKAEN